MFICLPPGLDKPTPSPIFKKIYIYSKIVKVMLQFMNILIKF